MTLGSLNLAAFDRLSAEAVLIWLMAAFEAGQGAGEDDVFRLDIDPAAMPSGWPMAWPRNVDGSVTLMVGSKPPAIKSMTDPDGWKIGNRDEGGGHFLPLRAVLALSATSGDREFTLRFDAPAG
jgi:hypothetical protein